MWILYPLMFFTGFVDSIAGGGGLISISSLLAVGVPPHVALGTNKFAAFWGTGLSAAYFAKSGHVRWDAAITSFLGAVAGSTTGAKLALMVNERTLSWCMFIIIPLVAIFLIFKPDMGSKEKDLSLGKTLVYSGIVGFIVGVYDDFIGPGTGTFLIMAFTFVLGFNILTSCGNAKIVNFASNCSAAITFMASGEVDYSIGAPCAFFVIAGNFVGTRLTIRNGVKIVRPMMILVIALLLAKVLWDLIRS